MDVNLFDTPLVEYKTFWGYFNEVVDISGSVPNPNCLDF